MRLNPDCIRDILMECEERCTPYKNAVFRPQTVFSRGENEYSWEETLYHLRQCELSGFFTRASRELSGAYRVIDITPKAHEFLENIRSDTVWKKTKETAAKAGSLSIDVLKTCASTVIAGIIKKSLEV